MGWLETIVNGVLLGGVYAVFGLGLAFAFGIMRIVNIAHGEFIILSAYIGLVFTASLGMDPFLVFLPVVLIAFALGYMLQGSLLNRVMGEDPLPPLLVTFGVSIVLRNAMVELFGADQKSIDPGPLRYASIDLAGLQVGVLPLITLAAGLALFLGLHLAVRHTAFGRTLRATADDFETVQQFGVNYRRVYAIAMGIALALSSIAGILFAMRTSFAPFSGSERLLLAFEVVIIGGLGSLRMMLLAGFLLGIVQLVGLRLDPDAGLLYGHIFFLAVLVLSPRGLAGFRR